MSERDLTAYYDKWFKWVPAAATDVTVTFRRFGWVPPSEDPEYQRKWRVWKLKLAGVDLNEEVQREQAAAAERGDATVIRDTPWAGRNKRGAK